MQNGRDEEPNKNLARELVENKDTEGIREIAENLWNRDKKIQSDCASVLEQIGHLAPELIEDYVSDFLKLLSSKNNRLVWGGMIALAMVADRKPREVFDNRDTIVEAIKDGSVITRDNGVKTLAIVASVNEEYNEALFPFLIEHLKSCRPKSIPQHAESIVRAVTPENQGQYTDVLNERFGTLSSSQQRRVRKLLRTLESGE
jgi:ribosomal protein L16 Arg81 hydroxylase